MPAASSSTPASTPAFVASLLLALALPGQAQTNESFTFEMPPPSSITGPTQTPLNFGGGRCTELARDIDALRGKPQRRLAAEQRFRAECQRDRQPFMPLGGPPSAGKPGQL